jgi:hypothetical protein
MDISALKDPRVIAGLLQNPAALAGLVEQLQAGQHAIDENRWTGAAMW